MTQRNRFSIVVLTHLILPLFLLASFSTTADAAQKETQRVIQKNSKIPPRARIQTKAVPAAPVLVAVALQSRVNGRISDSVSYQNTVGITYRASGDRPTHYRLSEYSGFPGADWRVYQANRRIQYTFSASQPGNKTVYFQLMNDGGRSAILSGSIEYRLPPVLQRLQINAGQVQSRRRANQAVTHERNIVVQWTFSGSATRLFLSENASFSNARSVVLSAGSGNSRTETLTANVGFMEIPDASNSVGDLASLNLPEMARHRSFRFEMEGYQDSSSWESLQETNSGSGADDVTLRLRGLVRPKPRGYIFNWVRTLHNNAGKPTFSAMLTSLGPDGQQVGNTPYSNIFLKRLVFPRMQKGESRAAYTEMHLHAEK